MNQNSVIESPPAEASGFTGQLLRAGLSVVFKLGVFLAGRIDNFKSFGART